MPANRIQDGNADGEISGQTNMAISESRELESLVGEGQANAWLGESEDDRSAVNAEDGSDKKLIKSEKRLVDRCVRGDVAAWQELYDKHHSALLRSISILLGTKGGDRNLVDELAAQVWYNLVDGDGKLLGRFCPKHAARLNTFLRAVAKDVTYRYFRTEQRRRKRELIAARLGSSGCDSDDSLDDSLSEFLGTLSESEREFTEQYLLSARGKDPGQGRTRTETSIWQFTRRIRIKLGSFFGDE